MNGICEPLYAQGTQDTYFMLLRLTGSGNTGFFVWGSGSGHQEVLLPPGGWGSVNLTAMASPAPTDSFPFTAKDLYYSAAMVAAQPHCGLEVQIWPGLVFESRSAAPDVRFGVGCAGLASSVAAFPIPGFSSYCFYSCVIELYFPRTFLIMLDTYQTGQQTNSFSKLLFWFILCLFCSGLHRALLGKLRSGACSTSSPSFPALGVCSCFSLVSSLLSSAAVAWVLPLS